MLGIIITVTLFCLVGIWCIGTDQGTDEWEAENYPDWLREVLQAGIEEEETDIDNG